MNEQRLSELVVQHKKEIADEYRRCLRSVLESRGRINYVMYIWSDGEIETLERVGTGGFLRPKDMEPRKLYLLCVVDRPCFDPFDTAEVSAPDDPDERDRLEQEIIDWYIDESDVESVIDDGIEELIYAEENAEI